MGSVAVGVTAAVAAVVAAVGSIVNRVVPEPYMVCAVALCTGALW